MSYKKNTIVISVPLNEETNQQLHEIAKAMKVKSKTQYASRVLESIIATQYKKIKQEQKP